MYSVNYALCNIIMPYKYIFKSTVYYDWLFTVICTTLWDTLHCWEPSFCCFVPTFIHNA